MNGKNQRRFKIIVLLTALRMDFNQRHRRPVEDKSPSSVYKQRQNGRNTDSDFRKQIHSRDEEIFMLSQTNDHLRQRLDQSVSQQNRTASQVEQKHTAPLRVKEGSRSRSPMRPQRDSSPGNFRSAPGYARDHIAALQNDNASLMRRLNLVLQELERVTQEKNCLLDQVDGSSKDIDEMHRVINSEDNTDKVNRYMQEDLSLERQQNTELRDRIKDNERTSSNLVQELKKLQDNGEVKADENTHCDSELRHKVEAIKQMESEHYYTVEKIKQCERLIQECRNEEAIDQRAKAQLQHKIGVLISERNELLQKLEQLTHKYDQTVREITADRQLITQHNKRQSNLVTSKILFTLLENLQKQRKTQALDEMKSYCLFDMKCQKKLGAFASTGQRQGQKLMKLALQRWFQNALEPTDKMFQSEVIIEKSRQSQLKAGCFHKWREAFIDRIKKYEDKTEAVKALQRYLKKDCKIEKARYFQIWKDDTQRLNAQKRQIQRLIWRKYFNKLNQGFNAWAGYSHYLDTQIRLRMLSAEYAQKNYQTAIFNNFKMYAMESRRKKFSRQLQAFKAWKDYHNKRKFFFHNNLATGQILKQNRIWLLKVCFDAFAKNKETRKYEKTHESLVETEEQKLQLGNEISERTETSKLKDSQMACNVVKTMLGKKVISYFLRWKAETDHGKQTMNLRVKQRIIKAYTTQIRQYFAIWKKQQNKKVRNLQQMEIQDQQMRSQALTNQTLELKKQVEAKQKIKDCKGKQGINKVFKRLERRQLEQAVSRWRDVYNMQLSKEQRARNLLKRYRCNYFKQAFDRFRAGVARKKKEQLCEARCLMFLQTQDERIKKLAYESIRIFVQRHVAARESFRRLDTRLNIARKRQGFKKWHKWNQRKLEKTLKNEQNTMTQQIVELNEKQGQLFQHEEGQKTSIKNQKGRLGKQAQRIISNAFARYYYTGLTRGFEKWREFNQFQEHKEKIIKRTEMRLRRNQLYFVKSAFRNWMLAADVAERTKQLSIEEQKVQDTHFQLDLQTKKFQEAQSNYHQELERLKEDSVVQNKRYQQSVQIVISQMQNNHYMSRQKYIFQQWALFVKRQKHFITSTINVINKSMWKEGFTQIKNAARSNDFEAKKERVLEQFRRKFYKRTCGNAFSKWRENGYKTILQTVHETESETQQVVQAHQEKKEQFKQCNMDKAQNHLHKQKLRHLWTGWVTVKNLMKFHRIKNEETNGAIGFYCKKKALQKWSSRLRATKRARVQVLKMKEAMRLMKLRLYFDQIKHSRDIHFSLTNRLNNFSKIFDHHQSQYAFKMIENYVVSKKVAHQKSKAIACEDLLKALQRMLKHQQQQTLCQLKVVPLLRYKSGLSRFTTIMKNLTQQQRTAFRLWKEGAKKRTLFKEMNEEGPVREEIWYLNQQQANLRQFMQEEGYSPEDLARLEKYGEKQQLHLLDKAKKRMEHYTEELFPLPKYFDRWRKWVAFKKIMRYQLNFAANRGEYLKADMASAFTQWKHHDHKLQKLYAAIPKSKLETRVIKNCEQIDGLAEEIGEKEAELGHLDIQREELMENYIKGQKLALALWLGNRRKGMHKAFSRWMNATRGSKQEEADAQMKHNMNILADLKERQRQLEEENQNFDEENTDLRQLTVDGYTMAQNAQKLEAEREQLSVDLADKAKTIKQLLQENEQLKFDLRQKQEEANHILRTIKKSERNNFSPMVKSGY